MPHEPTQPAEPGPQGAEPPPHKRRKRYRGTHPRRFEERYKELQADAYPGVREHIRAQGRTPAGTHVPVMVRQVLEHLDPRPGDLVADCTVGYGGHAMEFLRRIGSAGRLIGLDLDGEQLERTRQQLAGPGATFALHCTNFAGLPKVMAAEGIAGFDIIFADLGVSSMQLDDPRRGFSYKRDGPLDMRLGERVNRTAADLLAELSQEELESAFRRFGDEPDAAAVAQRIVQARRTSPITTTDRLARLVLEAKEPAGQGRGSRGARADDAGPHPAARVFQALRIAVNHELENLAQLLRVAPYCLRPGGRVGVLSFHSGEDRLVKHAFREGVRAGTYEAAAAEPIRPDGEEVRSNPRAGSARFRWARLVAIASRRRPR